MRRDTSGSRPPSANPGGERGLFRSNSSSGGGQRAPRPQTSAQRAVAPGRAAHGRSASRGRAQGLTLGAAIATGAAAVKGAYDNQMAENAKFKSFNEGKVAGRQTDSSGNRTPKSTYEAPMTKALIADGAKPVTKPK